MEEINGQISDLRLGGLSLITNHVQAENMQTAISCGIEKFEGWHDKRKPKVDFELKITSKI